MNDGTVLDVATPATAPPVDRPQAAAPAGSYVHLFPIPFVHLDWGDADGLNAALRARILAHSTEARGETRTNVGGWHSDSGQLEFLRELRKPIVDRMYAMANDATRRMAAECGLAMNHDLPWTFTAWANVSRRGDYHTAHNHPGATWSGVYYVDPGSPDPARESGAIRFFDPCQGRASSFFPFVAQNAAEVRPRAGLMLLFPSFVLHQVHPHGGDAPRISIAFNFRREPFP